MDFALLERLTQTFGPAGYEEQIRDVITEELAGSVDELRTDPLGSLVAYRQGRDSATRTMLAAHMDEIGLMVTHIEKEGFLRFTAIGGLNPLNCVGARARFANGTVGTIAVEHRDDTSKTPQLSQLYLDVGATSREDSPVQVGDPAVFIGPLVQQGQRWISKAMDDRIGCYVLVEMLRQLDKPTHDLYAVFTTQEEITLSGARTAAYRIEPHLAFSIDVTGTGDTPKALPMAVELGKGPAVKIKDRGMIAHPQARDSLIAAAEQAGLPYQREVLLYGSTDAAAIQLTRAGVPSGCLSIPCRFVHSPSEMVAANDVQHASDLLLTMLQS